MRKENYDNRKYFAFQDEQDEYTYALQNYGVKIKNRAKNKKKATKFSDRKERDLLPD